jgi:succinate dehydrogenase / fumarate reductase cytochrome b subunit
MIRANAMSEHVITGAAVRRFPLTGKQLMSILGVVPLGAYVVAHLWTNLYSINGAESFNTALVASRANPAFLFLEIAGLGIPIAIHSIIGIQIVGRMRVNNGSYTYFRNLKYLLQRISGIGVFFFLLAHVIKARIMPSFDSPGHETWQGMHEALSEPLTFTVYALGMLGISYHLANGLWSSGITLGLTTTPQGMRRMEWVSAFFFVILLCMSGLAIYGFQPTLFG